MSAPQFKFSQILESLMPIGIIFGLQALKLDYANPNVLLGFRVIFAVSVVIYLGVCYHIQSKIKSKEALLSTINVTYEKPLGMYDKIALQNEHQKLTASGAKVPPPKDTETVSEPASTYDLAQLKELAKSGLISYAMTGAIHLWGGYTQPIIITAIMSLHRITKAQLFRIHVLGQDAAGELQRPFKAEAGMLQNLLNPAGAAAEEEPTPAPAAPAVKAGGKKGASKKAE